MAQKGIREYDAKRMMASELPKYLPDAATCSYSGQAALWGPDTDFGDLAAANPWMAEAPLVVKPDQLFGKRGKHGLVLLNSDWKAARTWIEERMGTEVTVGETTGTLTHFLIEPFVPHPEEDEHYLAISARRDDDVIYFSPKGGIFVEENWDQVIQIPVPVLGDIDDIDVEKTVAFMGEKATNIARFITAVYKFYANGGFTYLEINPFACDSNGHIIPLDMVAKVDDTAAFDCRHLWGGLEFPKSFGTRNTPEEEYIEQLDSQTGASLKLTVLNPEARIWTMVAGGGASVIYADTVFDLGYGHELGNYGEYSGDPSQEMTYLYAKTLLDLMTRHKREEGKILLIGGGIANFTDVAKTFTGLIAALNEYKEKLIEHNVKIYVRRGGPNYKEGLAKMRKLGETLGVPIDVYGPETHMTKIVSLALGR